MSVSIVLALLSCGSARPHVHVVPIGEEPRAARPHAAPSTVRRLDDFPLPAGVTDIVASADARHVAYRPVSEDQHDYFVVADGDRQGPWGPPASPLVWSDRGGRLAYFAERTSDGSLTVVVDGREASPDDRLDRVAEPNGWMRAGSLTWSPDGRRLAAAVLRFGPAGVRAEVVVDGEPALDPGLRDPQVRWSPDGTKLAAFGSRGAELAVLVDGWEKPCTELDGSSLTWRSDSIEFAGRCGGRRALFLEGGPPIDVPAPLAGPAARSHGRLAYSMIAARQHQLVVDDRIRATHDQIAEITFLPDGSTVVMRTADGPLQRVVLLGAWESEPAETIVPGSLTVRSDGGCVAWSESGYGQSYVLMKAVPGRADACTDASKGPYAFVSKPLWNEDGGVSFVSSTSDEAILHVGDADVALGALPAPLVTLARAEDGRIAHFAAVDGSLWSVLRAEGDTTPVATLVHGAESAPPNDPHTTTEAVGPIPQDAERLAVHDRTQQVAWIAPSGNARRIWIDGVPRDWAPPYAGPSWSADGHLLFARAVTEAESEVVVDGAATARLEGASRLVPARSGPGWLAVSWEGVSHHVRSFAAPRAFSVGQSPPGALSSGADARHVLAVTASDYPPRILLDGRVVARGAWLGRVRWSEDGAHVLFAIDTGTEHRLYRDQRVVARGRKVLPLGFDRADRAAWVETKVSGETRVVVGDRRSEPLGAVLCESARWDPRAEHVALVALDREGRSLVLRDTEIVKRGLAAAREPTWSPDGARLAWVEEEKVVLGGEVVATGDVVMGSLRFAPDGRSLAWLSQSRDEEGAGSVSVRVGAATYGPYDAVEPPGVVFSPAGKAAWVARRGARRILVADGRALAEVDRLVPGAGPTWLDDGALGLLAIRARRTELARTRQIVRVRWRP